MIEEHKRKLLSLLALTGLLFGAVLPATVGFTFADDNNQSGQSGDGDDSSGGGSGEEEVSPDAIPDGVVAEALGALPNPTGITAENWKQYLKDAEKEGNVYNLEFEKDGQEYKVRVDFGGNTATLLEFESEDSEASESLGSHEDEHSVTVTSSDNSIEFNKDSPRLRFRVQTSSNSTTELKFEVEFKALVEFTDTSNPASGNSSNPGNGRLDEEEAVFTLDFESLQWNVTTTSASDQVVTYTASTTIDGKEYALKIEFTVPQSEGGDIAKAILTIDKWTWQESSNPHLLALISSLQAEVETEGVVLPPDAVQALEGNPGVSVAIEVNPLMIVFTFENKDGGTAYIAELEQEFKSSTSGSEKESEAATEVDAVVVFSHFDTASGPMVYDPSFGFIDDPVRVTLFKEVIQRITGIPFLSSTTLLYAAVAITIVALAFIVVGRRIALNHAFPAAR